MKILIEVPLNKERIGEALSIIKDRLPMTKPTDEISSDFYRVDNAHLLIDSIKEAIKDVRLCGMHGHYTGQRCPVCAAAKICPVCGKGIRI